MRSLWQKIEKPQIIFLFLATLFGLILVFLVPPFQVPDEGTHFKRAYQLSDGKLISEKKDGYVGGELPSSINEIESHFMILSPFENKDIKTSYADIISQKIPLNNREREFTGFANTSLYSPIPYAPQIIACLIGKASDMSPLFIMYLGRIFNLIVLISLIFLAIKIIPILKWALVMLGLMPMTLFEGASLSADPVTIGLSFLMIALILKWTFSESKINKNDALIFTLLSVGLMLSKQNYALIPFLFLIIPKTKFDKNVMPLFVFGAILSLALLGFWSVLAKNLYVPLREIVDMPEQKNYILHHPFRYIYILIYQIANWFCSDISASMIGRLGWLNISYPLWAIALYKISIVLVFLGEKKTLIFNTWQKIIPALIFILSIFMLFTIMYLTWSGVGSDRIEGVQGRYIIPILPLLFLPFYSKYFSTEKTICLPCFVTPVTIIMLIETIRILLLRYY